MSRGEVIESVVMLLSIPALWPLVKWIRTGAPLPAHYDLLLVGIIAALGVITIRRVRRLRAAFRGQDRRRPPNGPF